jgi:hypothetical protein
VIKLNDCLLTIFSIKSAMQAFVADRGILIAIFQAVCSKLNIVCLHLFHRLHLASISLLCLPQKWLTNDDSNQSPDH